MSEKELQELAFKLNDMEKHQRLEARNASENNSMAIHSILMTNAENFHTSLILTQALLDLKREFTDFKFNAVKRFPQLGD